MDFRKYLKIKWNGIKENYFGILRLSVINSDAQS